MQETRVTITVQAESRTECAMRLLRFAASLLAEGNDGREVTSKEGSSYGYGVTKWQFQDAE